ncbi:hypothetical protein HYT02_04455, partial [Candidatus Gottesmanbacteria bacterium]|nr:hypothetical protein [Candidatus Gottesmanbacteria bacterium]
INTVPSALTIDIDGIPLATPLTYDTLVGFQHTINAPNQTIGSSDYTFNSWDNGGTQSQLVTVPASNLSLTATYDVTQNSDPVTVRFYPQPGDGRAAYFGANNSGCGQAQWDIAKNTTTTGFDYTSSPRSNFVSTGCLGANAVNLTRAFLPFDTNSLPDNAVITNATLNLYITGKINSVNDGNDYIAVVQTSQVSTQSLTTSDYANLGNVEGSNNIDITTIPTYAYTTWTLDSTGLGWISKTGNTLLGLREGHDLQNVWGNYGGAQGNGVAAATSEQAGTIQDPYLDVTYYTPIGSPSGTPTPTPTPTSTPTPTPTATPTPTPTPTPTAAATPTPTPTPGGTPTTVTFYPQSGDGRVAYFGPSGSGCGLAQWNTAYNSTGSDAWADYTTSPRSNFVSTGCFGNNATSLSRAFLPFDTSSLPDNNTSLLVNTDYTQIGNQEGSNRVDITSMQLSTYTTWTLDSAGLGWISKTSNTLLGLREGHDLQNVWGNYGGGQGNSIKVVTSEQTGTTQDPYLEVTYTLN